MTQRWITIVAQLRDTQEARDLCKQLLDLAPTEQDCAYNHPASETGEPQVHIADGWDCVGEAASVSDEYQWRRVP